MKRLKQQVQSIEPKQRRRVYFARSELQSTIFDVVLVTKVFIEIDGFFRNDGLFFEVYDKSCHWLRARIDAQKFAHEKYLS